MNKAYIFILLGLMIPLVCALDSYHEPLDMYYLLVESVFGSVLLTGLGMVAFFFGVGMIAKMSPTFLIMYTGLFIVAFSIGYVGGIAAVILMVIALIYAFIGIYNFFFGGRT